MRFKIKKLPLETGGKFVAIINKVDAERLGVRALERVKISAGKNEIIAILDIASKLVKEGEIVLCEEAYKELGVKTGEIANVSSVSKPKSVEYIRKRLHGTYLSYDEIREIVRDTVEKNLSEIELAAFLTALYIRKVSMEEAEHLTRAMIEVGKTLEFEKKPVVDKHSIGGIPGDKTSIVAVPVIAAAGLTIPKTSSRAITSPAGTADRMECLACVEFSAEEIVRIVNKVGACLVWGGALELAPADDIFIQVEFPLGIDPMLFPSILAKKRSVGAEYVVIDIPTGRGAKIKTMEEALDLASDFSELGRRLGMNIACAITYGEQPLGRCIGPILEAREALLAVQNKAPEDVIDKACSIAGLLFKEVGNGDKTLALHIIKSGKAEKKLREIIDAQGGNPKIKPEDLSPGAQKLDVVAERSGKVLWIDNRAIAALAKAAGAPKHKGAGIFLYKKTGDRVRKGEKLFTIFAEKSSKLTAAQKLLEEETPFTIAKGYGTEMLLKSLRREREFILER